MESSISLYHSLGFVGHEETLARRVCEFSSFYQSILCCLWWYVYVNCYRNEREVVAFSLSHGRRFWDLGPWKM